MRIIVIGGGITGRLVQHRIPTARVCDWMSEPTAAKLTRSYGANYLWKPIEGLPCTTFPVVTHIDGRPPTMDGIRKYKEKIGKTYDLGSSTELELLADGQFREHSYGYDFEKLPGHHLEYNKRAVEINLYKRRVVWADGHVDPYDRLVSTIPLYALIELTNLRQRLYAIVGGGRWAFRFDPIYVRVITRPPDATFPPETLYVNYLTSADAPAYRYCDRFNERHYESLVPTQAIASKKIVPGKIHPIDQLQLLKDELAMYDVVTFGRFASWQPDELVHQTWTEIDAWASLIGVKTPWPK